VIGRPALALGMSIAISMAVLEKTSLASDELWALVARSLDVANFIGKPVTNSRWEQIACIERVLVDPADGRATFVVLSFFDREEMLALPWNALEIDARGRARLTAGRETLERAPRFYGARGNSLPSRFAELSFLDTPQEREASLPAFRIVSGGEGLLEGSVTGRFSLPAENGRRRAQALVDVGGETVRVDLGPEDGSAAAVRTGDHVQVLGRYQAGEEFKADEVRRGTSAFKIKR